MHAAIETWARCPAYIQASLAVAAVLATAGLPSIVIAAVRLGKHGTGATPRIVGVSVAASVLSGAILLFYSVRLRYFIFEPDIRAQEAANPGSAYTWVRGLYDQDFRLVAGVAIATLVINIAGLATWRAHARRAG